MSPDHTRRQLLRTLSGGTLVGVAGCITAGGPPATDEQADGEDGPADGDDEPTDGNGGGPGEQGTTGGPTDEPSTPTELATYGFEVRNELTVENFEASAELSDPQPAVVNLRVNNLDPDDEQTYFERTVELGVGETETFEEAFTVTSGRTMYVISAVLEPFVQGGLSGNRNRKASYTFTAGTEKMPDKNPITVGIVSLDDDSVGLYPVVSVNATDR